MEGEQAKQESVLRVQQHQLITHLSDDTAPKKRKVLKAIPASSDSFIPIKVRGSIAVPFAEVHYANGSRIVFHESAGSKAIAGHHKVKVHTSKQEHTDILQANRRAATRKGFNGLCGLVRNEVFAKPFKRGMS